MVPGLMSSEYFYNDERSTEEINVHDLCLSAAMACYPYPYLPILEDSVAPLLIPLPSDENNRDYKRLKRTVSVVDSIGRNSNNSSLCSGGSNISRSSSTNSLNSLPRLQFRDHIWTYTQGYYAAEAVEDATTASAAAMINAAEEGGDGKDGTADGKLCLSAAMACYPYPYLPLPIPEDSFAPLLIPLPSDENNRDYKRLKRTVSVVDSIGRNSNYSSLCSGGSNISRSSSTNSLNSLPRLQFRDHIWTYTQRYYAAVAVEEAAAAIINAAEEGGAGKDGTADRKLFKCG